MQSSLFRTRFESALQVLAGRTERKCMAALPERIMQVREKNRRKLQLCAVPMTAEEQDFVLKMLNEDWSYDFDQHGLVHYCGPGCCDSEDICKARVRQALEMVFGTFFDPPLMYRWKGWEPASHYITRGLAIHKLLVNIWTRCMSSDDRSFGLCFRNRF